MKRLFYGIALTFLMICVSVFEVGVTRTQLGAAETSSDPGGSWLMGWKYRKSHVVTDSAGAGVNYTVLITVINGTGTDSGGTVYCTRVAKSDFGDVRFTGSDGSTQWNYWMQTLYVGVNATFWVQIADNLTVADSTMYIYYGNPNVMTTSNGTNTFVKFDDFDNSVNIADGDQWNATAGATAYYAGSQYDVTVGNLGNQSGGGRNGILDVKALRPSLGQTSTYVTGVSNVHYITSGTVAIDFDCYIQTMRAYANYWVSYAFATFAYTDGTYWLVRLRDDYNPGFEWQTEDVLVGPTTGVGVSPSRTTVLSDAVGMWNSKSLKSTDYDSLDVSDLYLGVTIGRDNNIGYGCAECYFDNVRVRKYVSPEPNNGVWGSEENVLLIESVSRTPSSAPNYDQETTVSAAITNGSIVTATLSYATNGLNWFNVSMNGLGEVFSATIPAEPYNTTVQYKVYANDTIGNWVETDLYSYVVGDFVPPEIESVEWKPTNPWPYAPSNLTRPDEPVLVMANATEPTNASGVGSALLFYKADAGEWWNTTMTYNSTAELWMQTIPGQSNSTNTVEFFTQAFDNAGNMNTSSTFNYQIKHLPAGDVTGDGKDDIEDVATVAKHFGEHSP